MRLQMMDDGADGPVLAPLGDELRRARQAARLTIEQLAVAAGVGGATVERIEHGRVTPRRATLLALGLALSLPTTSEAAPAMGGSAKTREDGARHGPG